MKNELTYKSAMNYMKPYWPSGKRFTAELMIELVDGLKARQWEWDDFIEAVKKYREHWNWTRDEKFKQSPDLGQLLKLHKPKWAVEHPGLPVFNRNKKDEPKKKQFPIYVTKAAAKALREKNLKRYTQVFVDHYAEVENIDCQQKWKRYHQQVLEKGYYEREV